MPAVITADEVRAHLMDYEEDNQPLGIQYLSNTELTRCIEYAIEDFNETAPIFYRQYTIDDFPYKNLALEGACVKAFELTARREQRREMQYDDGGIQSSVYYKTPQFLQLKADLQQSYERNKARIKRHLNIQNCYGGIR